MAKAPGSRRRLYPMPVEPFIDHPEALTFPAAGFGILMRVALHFWNTECRPLPTADHEMRNISRAHAPTWRHWKEPIMRVFKEVEPELRGYFLRRENNRDHLIRLGTKGAAVNRFKAVKTADRTTIGREATALLRKRDPRVSDAPTPVEADHEDAKRMRRTG